MNESAVGDESVPKIITNNTINLFLTAVSILLISNHNTFRVVFDKVASVILFEKIYLYFSIGNGQPRKPALCQLYQHTFVTGTVYNKIEKLIKLAKLKTSQVHRMITQSDV